MFRIRDLPLTPSNTHRIADRLAGAGDLAECIRDAGVALISQRDFLPTPPADAVFLHCKLGGL